MLLQIQKVALMFACRIDMAVRVFEVGTLESIWAALIYKSHLILYREPISHDAFATDMLQVLNVFASLKFMESSAH